jgi:DNA replication protein DnaC
LLGPRGVGKTQLAAALIHAWSRLDFRPCARYWTLRDLFTLAKGEFDANPPPATPVLERARHASLLVLDEIGQADWTDWEQREFTALIDFRYAARPGPTLLIGNDKPESARERLGKSIVSRMAERGATVELVGWDFRMEAAQ